jgi:membrane associated rhomboid family serine protease
MLLSKKISLNIKKYFEGLNWKDLILFLLFPTFIFILMFFPFSDTLAFNINNPEIWQFFTHAFVHTDWNHFFGNLIAYLIFVGSLLIFSSKFESKKDVYILMIILIVLIPIITAISDYFFMPYKTSRGSSGVVSGFLGIIPSFIGYYFYKNHKKDILNYSLLFGIIYIGLVFIITYFDYHKNFILILLFILGIIIFLVLILTKIYTINLDKNMMKLLLFELLIFLLYVWFLFPETLIQNGISTNILSHNLGISLGIIISTLYFFIKLNILKN